MASPPFLPCLASSPRYIFAPEFPLFVNVPKFMGLRQYDRWGGASGRGVAAA